MALTAKLRSRQGAFKLEFESEFGKGDIWLSELPNSGILVIRVNGEGDEIEVEDNTRFQGRPT